VLSQANGPAACHTSPGPQQSLKGMIACALQDKFVAVASPTKGLS